MDPITLPRIFVCAILAVLFLQSGLDKITDRKGNMDWLVPHFANSPFKSTVGLLLTTLTIFELLSGVLAVAAIVMLALTRESWMGLISTSVACLTFVMLFTGQRLAKDYAGAASIATYSTFSLVGLYLFTLK